MSENNGSIIFNNLTRKGLKHQEEIIFESNFESGNLEYVTSNAEREYNLYMRADTNTRRHHQWFYFKIKNKQVKKVTLFLKNFIKSSMLYGKGLRPFVKSKKRGDICYSQI